MLELCLCNASHFKNLFGFSEKENKICRKFGFVFSEENKSSHSVEPLCELLV